jgi:hypothetical protein
MRGAIPPLPQHVLMAWCLVKHKDKFTFTYMDETKHLCFSQTKLKNANLWSLDFHCQPVSSAIIKNFVSVTRLNEGD